MTMVAAEAAAGGGAGAAGAGAAGGGAAGGSGAAGAGRAAGTPGARGARGARGGRGGKAQTRQRRAERGTDTPDRPETRQTRQDRGGRGDREDRQEREDRNAYRRAQEGSKSAKREIGSAKAMLPAKTYHRIVLAEFAACVLMIGATPILAPKTTSRKGHIEVDTGVTLAGPLVRLTATCVVFFVLALMASGQRAGKVAAAFGALVTLGVAMNSIDALTALAKVFNNGKTPSAAAGVGAGAAEGGSELGGAAGAIGSAAANTPIPEQNTA